MNHFVGCILVAGLFLSQLSNVSVGQSVLNQIGYTDLVSEFGGSLPSGSSAEVAVVEGATGAGYYLPSLTGSLAGKTVNDLGTLPMGVVIPGTSTHATGVAARFFGTGVSSSPGVTDIDGYDVNTWLNAALKLSTGVPPVAQPYDVSNHSYIFVPSVDDPTTIPDETFTSVEMQPILERFDYYVNISDTTAVVGTGNSDSTTLPLGFTPSYNAIAVGNSTPPGTVGSTGTVSGVTTFYGAGRTKVDIVAPEVNSSRATARVSSAAALLHDSGTGDAVRNQVVKATLMAGATKEEFPTWDRTTARPIDERFGAGELNVYNSYKIQQGGEFNGTTTLGGGVPVGDYGWDFDDSFDLTDESYYEFEVGAGETDNELSVLLTWNLDVTNVAPGIGFLADTNLADFTLELRDSSGALVDLSSSAVDNVEHIFQEDLAAGTYHLKVSRDVANDEKPLDIETFGLAWRFTSTPIAIIVPEPGSAMLVSSLTLGLLAKRRRKA